MRHLDGESRQQSSLLPDTLDDYVAEDHPVRVIDAFIEHLDFVDLGFTKASTKATGRKPYNPSDLLKLYVYGYLNQVRSSRRLEKECQRNLEVIWLMKRLSPDFKTIADFRKQNASAIRGACQAFIQFCRQADLLTGRLVAIDGSKFKAAASSDRVITRKQIKQRRERVTRLIDQYLKQMDQADGDAASMEIERDKVQRALRRLQAAGTRLDSAEAAMDERGSSQHCETDPDARLMRSGREGTFAGYNVQTAVDTDSGLIVHHEVTQDGNDINQLLPMAEQAQAALQADELDVVADAGYSNGEHLARCEEQGITATVPSHRAVNSQGDYYQRSAFRFDADRNSYWCPAGEELIYKTRATKDKLYLYTRDGCGSCALKSRCTRSERRWVSRHFYEEAYARSEARIAAQPALMAERRLVERPYGVIKQIMGMRRFLCWGREGAKSEMGIGILSYNLARMINEVGVSRMLSIIR